MQFQAVFIVEKAFTFFRTVFSSFFFRFQSNGAYLYVVLEPWNRYITMHDGEFMIVLNNYGIPSEIIGH